MPIKEPREAISTFVVPICFGNDLEISPQVDYVRGAFSLDDERTSFHSYPIALASAASGFVK